MASGRSASGGTMTVARRRAVVALVSLGLVASWFALVGTTFRGVYVEPTDVAMAKAAAARPAGILASAVQMFLAVAVAWAASDRWLVVLGLPGLLAGGSLLAVPSSHGAAWTLALLGSVPAVAVAAFRLARRRV